MMCPAVDDLGDRLFVQRGDAPKRLGSVARVLALGARDDVDPAGLAVLRVTVQLVDEGDRAAGAGDHRRQARVIVEVGRQLGVVCNIPPGTAAGTSYVKSIIAADSNAVVWTERDSRYYYSVEALRAGSPRRSGTSRRPVSVER